MGLFSRKEERKKDELIETYFKMINAYSPVFRSYSGGLYEMELTRSAIHAIANHMSKANPKVLGEKYKQLEPILQIRPNSIMSTSQFLYKMATIYFAENNMFIIPMYEDRSAGRIVGFFPVRAADTQIVKVGSKLMLKYKVQANDSLNANEFAIPYEEVGHMRGHYYRHELYGENNNAMIPTMQLLSTQKEAIINSVQQSANIRFMAKLANMIRPEDLKTEQKRLRDINLSSDNNGGIFLYDNKYADVKQVVSKPTTVDTDQARMIQGNVFSYFGVNEKILQNSYNEEEWNAFYEGKIEPFLIELSQVMSSMLFGYDEVKKGSMIIWESSRIQYASNATKLQLSTQLVDRGIITINDARMIHHLSPIKDGDKFYIRREYVEVNKLESEDNHDN